MRVQADAGRNAGDLRALSKTDLIRVAAQAVQDRHTAQVLHGRLIRRGWVHLAAVAAGACLAGIGIACVALL